MALTPEELERLKSLKSMIDQMPDDEEPQQSTLEQAKEVGGKALDYGLRGLDYAGGLVRTGVQQVGDLATGQDNAQWDDALAGKAKPMAQYLEDAGVQEGPTLSQGLDAAGLERAANYIKGGMLDVSARGAAGFAGDVALDPLTYLSGGLSAAGKAGKLGKVGKAANAILNPLEHLAEANSTRLYKKAFQEVDKKFIGKDARKLHELMKEQGFKGSLQEAAPVVKNINEASGQKIGEILTDAAEKGAKVDVNEAFSPAMDYASKLRKMGVKEADQLAEEIDSRIMKLEEAHGTSIPVDKANEVKSLINDHITNFAGSSNDSVSNAAKKEIASGLAKSVKKSVGGFDKDLGSLLEKQMNIYHRTNEEVMKKLEQAAGSAKNASGPFGTSKVDAMLFGLGLMGGGATAGSSFAPLAIKKTADAAMSTEGRTARAALNKAIAKNPKGAVDTLGRQSAWHLMKNKEDKK